MTLKEKLNDLHEEYYKEYVNMKTQDADYFLKVGMCSGVGDVIDYVDNNDFYYLDRKFWERLKKFIDNVEVNDPMSEEEKGMILNICDKNL